MVLCLFLTCVGTAFSFWVAGQPGAVNTGKLLPPPPLAGVKLEAGHVRMATAVNVTASPDAQWLADAAAQTGIPSRALRAYVAASSSANASSPACGIGWNTLAAIGSVESGHGTHGGGSLDTAGQASGTIVGPSLDGQGFAAIPDTDGGVLDGDSRWDRAVGPMQFIPSTWRLVGRDGNGDGTADPFNIDDAALGAATYLCLHGRDLRSAQGWTQAIYSYNQSDAYIRRVKDKAVTYATVTGALI